MLIEMQRNYTLTEKLEESNVNEEEELEELVEAVVEEKLEVKEKEKGVKGKKGKKGRKEEVDEEEVIEKVVEEVVAEPDYYNVALSLCFTLTMENGHAVKFLPNGDVLQKKLSSVQRDFRRPMDGLNFNGDGERLLDLENKRIVTGKGNVFLELRVSNGL